MYIFNKFHMLVKMYLSTSLGYVSAVHYSRPKGGR